MEFIIIIFIFIIFPIIGNFIEGLNLTNRPCDWCKKVKKGVRTKTVYIQRLGLPTLQKMGFKYHLCDKCAKNKSYVIIKETPEPPERFGDEYYYDFKDDNDY